MAQRTVDFSLSKGSSSLQSWDQRSETGSRKADQLARKGAYRGQLLNSHIGESLREEY